MQPTIGDRVIVRRRLPHTPGHLTDIIGHVESLNPLTVRPQSVGGMRSTAQPVEIPAHLIEVIKVLSPRTVRNSDIRAIEYATAQSFPGIAHQWAGSWLLRAGDGITERSNSAAPLGPSALFEPVPMEEIHHFYQQHNLPTRLLIPDRIGRAARTLTTGPHWEQGPEILVLTTDLDGEHIADMGTDPTEPLETFDAHTPDPHTHTPPGSGDVATYLNEQARHILPPHLRCEVSTQPDEEWLRMYHFRGQELPTHALNLLRTRIHGVMGFGKLTHDGHTVAITRGTLTASPDGRIWLGYSAVEVAPDHRRQGLGTHLGRMMMLWGAAYGAHQAYLQVIEANQAGRALYKRLGFLEHHRHRYVTYTG